MTRRSKYNSRKTEVDGFLFDSKLEAARYSQLRLLYYADKITSLELQPRFTLLPKFRHKGKAIRKIEYVPDFMYKEAGNDTPVVEEVKGKWTDTAKIKSKWFMHLYCRGGDGLRRYDYRILTKDDI